MSFSEDRAWFRGRFGRGGAPVYEEMIAERDRFIVDLQAEIARLKASAECMYPHVQVSQCYDDITGLPYTVITRLETA